MYFYKKIYKSKEKGRFRIDFLCNGRIYLWPTVEITNTFGFEIQIMFLMFELDLMFNYWPVIDDYETEN